jgi:hypothetical protein
MEYLRKKRHDDALARLTFFSCLTLHASGSLQAQGILLFATYHSRDIVVAFPTDRVLGCPTTTTFSTIASSQLPHTALQDGCTRYVWNDTLTE